MHRLLIDLPASLETERLVVRPYTPGDGPAYLDVCLRNREHLRTFEGGNPALSVTTLEDAETLVRQLAADWAARTAFFFGAWEKLTGAFACQVYLGPVDWDLPEFEVGYFADCEHEGQGYVTEAVRAVLGMAFDLLGAHRVSLRCSDSNPRSARVAERCGFTREGHLLECSSHIRLPDGTPTGDLLYGLLRAEYERSNPTRG